MGAARTFSVLAALLMALVAEARGAAPRLALAPCEIQITSDTAQCGTLEVFEDRAAGTRRRIPIKVLVLKATGPSPAPDPVFIIPGGPGQSATELAPIVARELAFARPRRDLVFVDQRGTGGSNPLQCSLGGSLDEIVQAVGVGVDANLDAVRACRRELEARADLRLYTTSLAMDDLDDVRAALGYERINLFGVSYGTRAALVYVRQHTGRVRSMILRALGSVEINLPLTVAPDAERALTRLFAACRGDSACRAAYPDVQRDLETVLARLSKSPATVEARDPRSGKLETVRIDEGVFGTGIFFLLFLTDWSRHLPFIVQAAAVGNLQPFTSTVVPVLAATAVPVHWGMRRSVLCSEDVAQITEAEVRAAGAETMVGPDANLGLLASCREWPVGRVPSGYYEPVKTDVPALVINGEEDPVLPPVRAESALKHMTRATHIVVPNVAHGPDFPGCVEGLAAEFLEAGSAEKLDTACAAGVARPTFTLPK